jgi:hypothetical protein
VLAGSPEPRCQVLGDPARRITPPNPRAVDAAAPSSAARLMHIVQRTLGALTNHHFVHTMYV